MSNVNLIARLFVIVALFFGAVQATQNWQLTYVATYFDINQDATVYLYDVSATGEDIVSFVLTSANCAGSAPTLKPSPYWQNYAGGYRYRHPINKDTTRRVSVAFAGELGSGAVSASLRGSVSSASFNTVGPDCSAPSNYPVVNPSGFADVTVNCSTTSTIQGDLTIPGRCPAEYVVYRYHNASSGGLNSQYTQKITVVDQTAPTFVPSKLDNIVIECSDQPANPSLPSVTATDNCDPHVADSINICTERVNGSCPGQFFITHTWTATDECGNSKCLTLTITQQDTTAPELHGVPADTTYECDPLLEDTRVAPPTVTATDSCKPQCFANPAHPVSFTETHIDGACRHTFTLERYWSATDCCGNEVTAVQYLTIKDTTPPVIVFDDPEPGPTSNAPCNNIPPVPRTHATDSCTTATVVFNETRTDGSCPFSYTLTRVWRATDECGNTATVSKVLIIQDLPDTNSPWFNSLPSDTTVECGNVPPVPVITASDKCGTPTVYFNSTTHDTNCVNEYTIVRTFTAVDACGNTNVTTQTVHVVDNTPPRVDETTIPNDQSVQCSENLIATPSINTVVISPEPTGTADSRPCDNFANRDFYVISGTRLCPNKYTDILVWNFTDCSGNPASYIRHNVVNDTTRPTITGVPSDTTVECNAVPNPANPSTSDNCITGATLNYHQDRFDGSCPHTYTLVRTWVSTDACSNTATSTQTINVRDTTPPQFTTSPINVNATCDNVPARPTVAATDNCATPTITDLPDETVPGDCANRYTLIRKWRATDACGNTNTFTATYHVYDNTNPQLPNFPADTSADCSAVPIPSDVCVTDNCAGVNLTYTQTRTNGICEGTYTLTRTYAAMDNCGNTYQQSQTVHVSDTKPPTIVGPADTSVSCETAPGSFPATPTATDDCSSFQIFNFSYLESGSCQNAYKVHEAFQAVDQCGNSAWKNYTITVYDTTPPQLQNTPSDTTVQCTAIPPPATVTSTDNCVGNKPVSYDQTKLPGSCTGAYQLKRTWTAVDDCLNTASFVQTVTVVDTVVPTFDNQPADTTVDCVEPTPPTVTGTDNCGGPVGSNYSSTSTGSCPRIVTRVWYISDDCGNTNSYSQRVTVQDITNPTLTNLPADTTVECSSIPVPADVCASDNCDGVTFGYNQNRVDGSCQDTYTLTRTWLATDACGNHASHVQTLHVQDTTAPTLSSVTDTTVECTNIPNPVTPTVSDNCHIASGQPTYDQTKIPGTCTGNYKLRRVWTAVDACQNTASVVQTVNVQDTTPPTFNNAPADTTVDCTDPAVPVVTASDACGGSVGVNYTESRSGSCPTTLLRIWVATDDCNLQTTHIQTITIRDINNPTVTAPPTTTVECSAVPAPADVCAQDNCNNGITLNFNQVRNDGSCPYAYDLVRTWTAIDHCGNTASSIQTVHVQDTTSPTFTVPANAEVTDVAVVCNPPGPATVTANDNCGAATVTVTTQNNTVCPYDTTLTHTWVAVDSCQNTHTDSQTIHYHNIVPPTLVWSTNPGLPSDTTVECDSVPAAEVLTAHDACGQPLTPKLNETILHNTNCGNAYTIVRTWYVVDGCGLTASHQQEITVQDTTPPAITGNPADTAIECGFVSLPPKVTATDNCPTVSLTYTETRHNGSNCCTYELVRQWVATDDCGLTTTAVQTITVRDHIPPMFHNVPPDTTVPCDGVPAPANVTAHEAPLVTGYCVDQTTDSCTPLPVPADFSVTTPANGLALYTFVQPSIIVTVLNNQAWVYALVKASDNSLFDLRLTFSSQTTGLAGVLGLNSPCYTSGLVDALSWSFYANVSGNLTRQSNPSDVTYFTIGANPAQFGLGASNRNANPGLAAWFSVVGGGSATLSASVLKDDGTGTGPCVINQPGLPSLDCGDAIRVNYTQVRLNGSCPNNYDLVRTWVATDPSGNSATATQTVHVYDNSAPTFLDAPQDTSIACDATLPWPPVHVTDNCDNNVPILNSTSVVNSTCPYNRVEERTWTATDSCGNSATALQWVTVYDDVAPTITGVPSLDTTVECDNIPPPPSPTASDNCDPSPDLAGPTNTDTPLSGPTCPQHYKQVRRWIATDACGLKTTAEYDVNVQDTTPPVLHNVPAATTVECLTNVPVPTVTYTDNCSPPGDAIYDGEVPTNTNCANVKSVVRTWHAADQCGHTVSAQQTITYVDTTKPQWTSSLPADTTVPCDNVPAADTLTASDNCLGQTTVTYDQTKNPGSCPNAYTLVRYWRATDCSGNFIDHTQTVTVVDTSVPQLNGVPSDTTVECTAVPTPADVCASDNCPGLDFQYTQTKTTLNCPANYDLVRTWTATDACHNVASGIQTIHVRDTTKPVWNANSLPHSFNVSCDLEQQNIPSNPTATDNCGTNTVKLDITTTPGSCPQSKTKLYSWKVTDECGNFDFWNITVFIFDHTDPVLHNVPTDTTVECTAVPAAPVVTATDNCDLDVPVNYDAYNTSSTCTGSYLLIRSWDAVDDCLNSVSDVQTVTVRDTIAPVFDQSPQDTTVDCTLPIQPTLTATDNCGPATVVPSQRELSRTCLHRFDTEFKWVATDDCGNSRTVTSVAHVYDGTNPQLQNVPADTTVQCDAVPAPADVCATDNCDQLTLSFNQSRQDGSCSYAYKLVRTWTAVDACSNSASGVQTVTVHDTVSPQFQSPYTDTTVQCDSVPAIPSAPPATDNCGVPSVSPAHTRNDGSCSYAYDLVRKWVATDACGNTATTSFIVHVHDTVAPQFVNPAPDTTVECSNIPAAVWPEVTDNCAQDAQITKDYNENRNPPTGCQSYQFTRTWTITDNCGNSNSHVQTITVQDTTNPTWTTSPLPQDTTVSCESVPAHATLLATDNCGAVTVTYNENRVNGSCINQYDLVRTWTATDSCQHSISHVQTVHVRDDTAPVISTSPADTTVECTAVPTPAEMCASDNCAGVDLHYAQVRVNGSCDNQYDLVRTWTAVDACNSHSSYVQTVHVHDTTPPTATGVPANTVVECTNPPTQMDLPSLQDNCGAVNVTKNSYRTEGSCDADYTMHYEWHLMDSCGNTNSYTQNVTVVDTQAPQITPHPTCYEVSNFEPIFYIYDVSVNGHLFDYSDTCSAVSIHIDSCHSNQYDNSTVNFIQDCVYNPTTDTLTVRGVFDWLQPDGRVFYLTATVTDDCGHSATQTVNIWIPMNDNSNPPGQFPQGFNTSQCVPAPCMPTCPCEYFFPTCTETDSTGWSVALNSFAYDIATDSTTFTYHLTSGATRPGYVLLGFDLTNLQVVSYSPTAGTHLGFHRDPSDTYISGISFAAATANVFTVTFRGNYNEDPASLPYVVSNAAVGNLFDEYIRNGPTTCNVVSKIGGPKLVAPASGVGTISGKVLIQGVAFTGVDANIQIPMAQIAVQLRDSTQQVLRSTLTATDGSFSFVGVPAGSYFLFTPEESFFLDAREAIGHYFTAPSASVTYPHGAPLAVTQSSTNVIIPILLQDTPLGVPSVPVYSIQNPGNSFHGNPYSLAFWQYQYTTLDSQCGFTALPSATLNTVLSRAQQLAPACGSTAQIRTILGGAPSAKQKLIAAFLNQANGRGPFELYRVVTDLQLKYAYQVLCVLSTPSTDELAKAEAFVDGWLAAQ